MTIYHIDRHPWEETISSTSEGISLARFQRTETDYAMVLEGWRHTILSWSSLVPTIYTILSQKHGSCKLFHSRSKSMYKCRVSYPYPTHIVSYAELFANNPIEPICDLK